jgi:hypothetical protein
VQAAAHDLEAEEVFDDGEVLVVRPRRSRAPERVEELFDALSAGGAEPVEVTPKDISAMDQARGRYAHRSAERDAQPAPEAEHRLRESALALLRRALSI